LDEIAEKFGLSPAALDETLQRCKEILFEVREERIKPARDEKVLTSWNGLMLAAFAEAARVLDRPDYLTLAVNNAAFILDTMLNDGRLFRTWKAQPGKAKLMGYLEDYAFYADGLLALYQSTFDPNYFEHAQQLVNVVLEHFSDTQHGGFFDTADDHEQLITRPKSMQDNAIPCGNSMAVRVLLAMAAYTGDSQYETPALRALVGLQEPMVQYPSAFTHWLGNLEFVLGAPKEIAIIGPLDTQPTKQMLGLLQRDYYPNQFIAVAEETKTAGHPPLVENRPTLDGQTTVYVCQNFTCRQPVTTVEELSTLVKTPK
jgi:uncharacterized protein YyaL (SSP411 family)